TFSQRPPFGIRRSAVSPAKLRRRNNAIVPMLPGTHETPSPAVLSVPLNRAYSHPTHLLAPGLTVASRLRHRRELLILPGVGDFISRLNTLDTPLSFRCSAFVPISSASWCFVTRPTSALPSPGSTYRAWSEWIR